MPIFVDANICLGGEFTTQDGIKEYVGGVVYKKLCLWMSELDVRNLRVEVERAMVLVYNGKVAPNFSMWYRLEGCSLTTGCKLIESEDDIVSLVDGRDFKDTVTIYVVEYWDGGKKKKQPARPKIKRDPDFENQPKPLQVLSPNRRSPRINFGPDMVYLGTHTPPTEHVADPIKKTSPSPKKAISPAATNIPTSSTTPITSPPIPTKTKKPPPDTSQKNSPCRRKNVAKKPSTLTKSPTKAAVKANVARKPSITVKPQPTRRLQETFKKTQPVVHSAEAGAGEVKSVKKQVNSGKKKAKNKKKQVDEDYEGEEHWSSDSEFSDLDVNFEPPEEDYAGEGGEDAFTQTRPKEITKQVNITRGKTRLQTSREVLNDTEIGAAEEADYESEELRSLDGSDAEVDPYPTFNPSTDFSKKIDLVKGLKFRDIDVLRKALRYHAIENHYNYYYLHNGGNRVTTYCRYKCQCPWDKKHGKIMKCVCEEEYKCHFRVYARRIKGEQMFQIKGLKLQHVCGYQDSNAKVSSEFLADKYLEFFRSNPCYKLKDLQTQVRLDMGVFIGYFKAWYTRARAKFILYGDASEEYGRVHDYAAAILKYNPGSTSIVKCETMRDGSMVFQRMYVCLSACKIGFKSGCRPVVGVDGCHLKGQHPGMILVAVAKDGNNNIFPLAWSVVEAENKESWTWFMELLMNDLDFVDGEGLTLMSDRQKGLVDAMASKAPKAEVRYCVRHIWANFKLQFSGQAFKEHFWHAARTSNKYTFKMEMQNIKKLDVKAFDYLNEIPTKHWARHAFQTTSKSNMLLNNLCETFNSVIREARDKPIIGCMEWIRRYVMRRNFEKFEGISSHHGRLMPYIKKVFEWTSKEAQSCSVLQSATDEWEVEHIDDKHVVNLKDRTCTCLKWELTGIPCPHAFACITKRRENPDTYVHSYYSKSTYQLVYKEKIKPMPGMQHWDECNLPKPLPPLLRKMPGRPSKKKRKRSASEADEKYVKRAKKQNNCSNCGMPGHYKTKCTNPPAPPKPKNKGGRPPNTDPWSINKRLKRQSKNLDLQNEQTSVLSTKANNKKQTIETATTSQLEFQESQASAVTSPAYVPNPRRAKLPVKSKSKKQD